MAQLSLQLEDKVASLEVCSFQATAIFFFFFLFRAAPEAYGGSQARGPIGSEPHLRPTPQLMAWPDP